MQNFKLIISGGGTGGHIFPALSIANAVKSKYPDAEILFIGAENRMEMERVPAMGYPIIGLPVAGFDRKNLLKNIIVLFKLIQSLLKARKIVKNFKPDIVIGVGGYAGGPTLRAANQLRIPTLLQEQNSYAGVTNKLLSKKAATICVAYEGMETFFPKEKIVLTGNPIRRDLACSDKKRKAAFDYFNLDPAKKTILVLGGSLGARTINESVLSSIEAIRNSDAQFIWQCGKYYYKDMQLKIETGEQKTENIRLLEFISRMDLAYSVADLVISRAGAGSISELSVLGKSIILVPSPNVAEDHQTKNAMALAKNNAAVMIADKDARKELIPKALELIDNKIQLQELSSNILKRALPDADAKILNEIEKIVGIWE
ncbi:UDP-N-acetylglucosamine--N-acetylmuramyl-(pentapeptide) pyrophosphoryl-undecaprenol N-acetylglucosamine transferase [Bacteroidia bacterium]|nr:UDP-N-acetylglucosamine--N-acetylmuramyl-(pentapeptide) pyrophosphoryl-undecaprenol N-acetylglucosamine transferase [Bacteroidia bacterium]